MIDVGAIMSLVESFRPSPASWARRSVADTLQFLRTASRDATARTNYQPGHITTSGVVLAPAGDRVLLVYHRRLRRWLQPGGHVEPRDPDLVAAARREVAEETSVTVDPGVPPTLVGVEVHSIPAAGGEPGHLHFDLAFRFVALESRHATPDALRTAWCPVDSLGEFGADAPLVRAVARARHGPGHPPPVAARQPLAGPSASHLGSR